MIGNTTDFVDSKTTKRQMDLETEKVKEEEKIEERQVQNENEEMITQKNPRKSFFKIMRNESKRFTSLGFNVYFYLSVLQFIKRFKKLYQFFGFDISDNKTRVICTLHISYVLYFPVFFYDLYKEVFEDRLKTMFKEVAIEDVSDTFCQK